MPCRLNSAQIQSIQQCNIAWGFSITSTYCGLSCSPIQPGSVQLYDEAITDPEEEMSDYAIEDDEDAEVWEPDEKDMFDGVDCRPCLTARRSLLTRLMHEKDLVTTLQSAVSNSATEFRRPRTPFPHDLLRALPVQEYDIPEAFRSQLQRIKGPVTTTSDTHSRRIAPRGAHQCMGFNGLSASVRENLICGLQAQQLPPPKPRFIRRQVVKDLREHQGDPNRLEERRINWNRYFDTSLQGY